MRIAIANIGRLIVRAEMSRVEALEGATLLVEDGRIIDASPSGRIPDCAEVVDAQGSLVTPGLIDAHTHLVFGGDRADEFEKRSQGSTYEQIAAEGGGILGSVAKTRASSEDELAHSAARRARWMIANGTTFCESKTGYGLDVETELRCLRALRRAAAETGIGTSATVLLLHAAPPELPNCRAFAADCIEALLPAVLAQSPEVRWLDAFYERGYFDAEAIRALAEFARLRGLGLRLHVDQLSDGGGAALATEIGAKTADHLENTGLQGIMALAASGTIPVLLPASVFALGKPRYPDARAMLDAGLPVVLATDFNPGSSPTPSLPFVMSIACTQMGMSPAEALAGCTMHAASSLEIDEERGSLEVGKIADFVLWYCRHEREIPYWIGAPLVRQTWIGGIKRYESPSG